MSLIGNIVSELVGIALGSVSVKGASCRPNGLVLLGIWLSTAVVWVLAWQLCGRYPNRFVFGFSLGTSLLFLAMALRETFGILKRGAQQGGAAEAPRAPR